MLYKLFMYLKTIDPGFNVFRYITFRTALSVLTALGLSFILGPWVIGRLKTVQPGNYVREYLPEGHVLKADVPTMGGTLILLAISISTLLWSDLSNRMVWVVLAVFAGFGLLGLVDDMLKLYGKNNKGLSIKTKFSVQVLMATMVAVYLYMYPSSDWGHHLQLPFFKDASDLPFPSLVERFKFCPSPAPVIDQLPNSISAPGILPVAPRFAHRFVYLEVKTASGEVEAVKLLLCEQMFFNRVAHHNVWIKLV